MKGYITDDRGQVGIGTLIVFIALVLVAAIAAGVLINTAGFLQTQAEDTGQDSTDQVADNINVIGEVGDVAEEDDIGDTHEFTEPVIYQERLTVQRSPGSGDIDLSGLSIQYVGDNGFAQLVHVSDGDGEVENAYLIDDITAESEEDAVITDDGDRYDIVIPLGIAAETDGNIDEINDDDEFVDGDGSSVDTTEVFNDDVTGEDNFDNTELGFLAEGMEADIEITTEAGATRVVAISAPDTLIDEEGGTVTL